MKKKWVYTLIFFLTFAATSLFAEGVDKTSIYKWTVIIGGAAIALAASVGAIAQSRVVVKSAEAISRNPGIADHIRFVLIFGIVMIESLVIYTLFISIVLFFINPGKFVF